MSQSSSQQLEAADWDQSEAAWRATHAPVVAHKPPKVELPVDRLEVVDSSFDWRRAIPDTMASPLLPRNTTVAEVVLMLLLPEARAICSCFNDNSFDDTFFSNVFLGETLWRTQSAMRHAPLREVWYGHFVSK